jgi:hypothetical protein
MLKAMSDCLGRSCARTGRLGRRSVPPSSSSRCVPSCSWCPRRCPARRLTNGRRARRGARRSETGMAATADRLADALLKLEVVEQVLAVALCLGQRPVGIPISRMVPC